MNIDNDSERHDRILKIFSLINRPSRGKRRYLGGSGTEKKGRPRSRGVPREVYPCIVLGDHALWSLVVKRDQDGT